MQLFLNIVNKINIELDKIGINLFISVFAPYTKPNNKSLILDNIQDINQLVELCDKLVILFYDFSLNGNGSGNSPIKWIKDTLSKINSTFTNKIIVGLPLFAYEVNQQNQIIRSYTYAQLKTYFDLSKASIDINSDEFFCLIQIIKFIL